MIALLAALAIAGTAGPVRPTGDYLMFVASEGNDRIALVRFGPTGARVERERQISLNPTELVGPARAVGEPDGSGTTSPPRTGRPTGRCGSSPPPTTGRRAW